MASILVCIFVHLLWGKPPAMCEQPYKETQWWKTKASYNGHTSELDSSPTSSPARPSSDVLLIDCNLVRD